jgi:hypothetical protein
MDFEEVVMRAIEILFKYLSFFKLSLGRLFALGETQTSSGGFTCHQESSFYLMGWIFYRSAMNEPTCLSEVQGSHLPYPLILEAMNNHT